LSDIRPFKGLRPPVDLVAKVASPPYDVLSSAEARVMAAGNPYSFLRVSKAEIDLPEDIDVHGDEVYEKSAETFRRFLADGVLVRDPQDCFYIYRLTMGGHVQHGIVAGFSVQEYEDDLIRKHELTRREKEDDRARHVEKLMANAGPVLLTFRNQPQIRALVDQITATAPVCDFVADDGIGHTLWVVQEPAQVQALQAAFAAIPATYVADGHHRSASAYRVRNNLRERNPQHTGEEGYNHFLAVAFPDDELQIMGYHRVVQDLHGLSVEEFLARVGERFTVVETDDRSRGRPGLHDAPGGPVVSPDRQAGQLPARRSGQEPRRGHPAGQPAGADPGHRRPAHEQAHRFRRRHPRHRRAGQALPERHAGGLRAVSGERGPAHGHRRRRGDHAPQEHLVRTQAAFGRGRPHARGLTSKGAHDADPDLRRLRSPGCRPSWPASARSPTT
jgi:uncharacterized protein (DUF1015 family)